MSDLITDRFIRPMDRAEALSYCRISALFYLGGAAACAAGVVLLADRDVRQPQLIWLNVAACLAAVAWYVVLPLTREEVFDRLVGPTFLALSLVSTVVVTIAVVVVDDVLPEVAGFYAQTIVIVFLVLRRQLANLLVVFNMATFGVALVLRSADIPILRFVWVMGPIVIVAYLVGPLPGRWAEAARDADNARAELAEVNSGLAERVAHQVTELERAGRLRRFLSPEVADAVLSDDHLLEPHRREIAVFFADLRGFTAFAGSAEPEEVLAVLNEYYEAVGSVLRQHGATIGDYTGDGIMAFLGDPLPRPQAAREVLACAAQARDALAVLTASWRRRGHALGAGIGVAYGYATLGVVGFDERRSYAALGSVVNLAARLCSVAADGQVLVDSRTVLAAGVELPETGRHALKGFGDVGVHILPG